MTMNNYVVVADGGGTTGSWSNAITYSSGAGTSVRLIGTQIVTNDEEVTEAVESTGSKKPSRRPKRIPVTAGRNINPKVYFKFVKSKLGKIELDMLKRNLNKLARMIVTAEELGQQALFEQLSQQLAITVREQEAHACGYDKRIDKEHIEKFRNRVQDKVIRFEPFAKFPRVVPAQVAEKIQKVQSLGIFDEYWVLFIDYTGEELPKTNKEKIREKDPILFGRFAFQPDVYYYILDWIDKYCDLTIGKLIEELQVDDPEFALNAVPDVDETYIASIVEEVKIRTERLKNTNSKNYKDLMEEEEVQKEARKKSRTAKKTSEPPKEKEEGILAKASKAIKRIPFVKK